MENTAYIALSNYDKISSDIMAKILYHSDLNKQNIDGITPLHVLCRINKWKDYKKILEHKYLNIFVKDNREMTPVEYIKTDEVNNFYDLVVQSYINLNSENKNMDNKEFLNKRSNCIKNLKSKKCLNVIKKYILNTKRAYPKNKDIKYINKEIKLISNDVNKSIHGLFNSDTFHSVIYTLELLKKYKNLGIPYQRYIGDKYVNDNIKNGLYNLYKDTYGSMITDIVKIYNDYFYELLPYLIVWRGPNEYYINPDLDFYIQRCIISKKIRFICLKLTMVISPNGTHANLIIYDKKTNLLERFEPYGIMPYLDSDILDNLLKKKMEKILNKKVIYYNHEAKMNKIGLQTISNDDKVGVKKLGDPVGYCLAWIFWYLEMRLSNPNVEPEKMMDNAILKIINNNKDESIEKNNKMFINFIRNYANKLNELKNNFLIKAGIDKENIYNLVLSKSDQQKLIKKYVSDLKLIMNEREI